MLALGIFLVVAAIGCVFVGAFLGVRRAFSPSQDYSLNGGEFVLGAIVLLVIGVLVIKAANSPYYGP